ncbi:Rab GTPase-activating protein 1 [Anas platyrhynchos]|uniref:Rab GTPase-activating protein 1 n=1 Tax=Anas platyrhynchos TaxID=8839 RepID=R0LIS7_ANAPL|nr:Rab GTPase-activating protein 1 [Anas platyrhynchos]
MYVGMQIVHVELAEMMQHLQEAWTEISSMAVNKQLASSPVTISEKMAVFLLSVLRLLTFSSLLRFLTSSNISFKTVFIILSLKSKEEGKAYSVYDEDIGYCQGQSFLAAVLLLHMPEEQAFCVFVKIMYDYGLRDLYRNNFEDLHCKFFQLEKLMQEQLPDLYSHFSDLNLEAHMYASQWFLTLFTAKFPLCMVFHIIDLLLCEPVLLTLDTYYLLLMEEGVPCKTPAAKLTPPVKKSQDMHDERSKLVNEYACRVLELLGMGHRLFVPRLLATSKEDLLQADFEGALKFFRVQLPKRYRAEENARRLMEQACNIKSNAINKKSVEAKQISPTTEAELKASEMQQCTLPICLSFLEQRSALFLLFFLASS